MALPPEMEAPGLDGKEPGIGYLFKASRERCGITLEDAAGTLCIRQVYLRAIEEGRFEALPGSIYTLGFIRAYADFLGLDSEAVVQRFKAENEDLENEPTLAFPDIVPENGIPGGALLMVGLLIAAVGYGGWYFVTSRDSFVTVAGPPPSPAAEPSAAIAAPTPPRPALQPAAPVSAPPAAPVSAPPAASVSAPPAAPVSAPPAAPVSAPPAVSVSAPPAALVSAPPAALVSAPPAARDTPPAQAVAPPPATVSEEPPRPEPAPPAARVEVRTEAAPAARVVASAPAQPVPERAEPAAAEPLPAAAAPEAEAAAIPEAAKPKDTPSDAPAHQIQLAARTAGTEEASGEATDAAPPPTDPRIVVKAKLDSWVQIRDDTANRLIMSRVLRQGDSFVVPNRPGLTLLAGNAGAIEILVDGEVVPAIGAPGKVRRHVALEASRLRYGEAVIE